MAPPPPEEQPTEVSRPDEPTPARDGS
jgi:hypothetical protein